MQIRLATRGSRLALAQSGLVADALRRLGAHVELVRVRTFGDDSAAPLASIGGTGVFVAAVREAVLNGDCDAAVHSLKDLPTTSHRDLALAAIPVREDPRDALCSRPGMTLAGLPQGARVGTGSPRRAAQLLAARPDLEVVDIRGNVETRLARVGDDLDAVVLAAAGLNRIGRADAVTELLDPEVLMPAPAQGALAIECRHGDRALRDLLARLDDEDTRAAVEAERLVLRAVEAGCTAPFGALARVDAGELTLTARLAAPSGTRTASATGPVDQLERLAGGLVRAVAPLSGLRVLMPPSRLADALAVEGVRVTTVTLTRTEPLDVTAYLEALATGCDVVAFTSARSFEVLAAAGVRIAELVEPGTAVAAVGEATASAAREAGLEVGLRPASGSGGAALAAAFPDGAGRVVIGGAERPAPDLAAALRDRGWSVVEVPLYRTVPAPAVDGTVLAAWPMDFDAFVVTAPSTAAAAEALIGVPGPPVVALGPTSAAAASGLGFDVVATADTATATGLARALAVLRKEQS